MRFGRNTMDRKVKMDLVKVMEMNMEKRYQRVRMNTYLRRRKRHAAMKIMMLRMMKDTRKECNRSLLG